MADVLIKLLQQRTVLIVTDTSVGTGTFIAPGKVLSCAHVVRSAAAEGKNIFIKLPNLTEPGHFIWEVKASEVQLSSIFEVKSDLDPRRPAEGSKILTTEYPDVAVLSIEKKEHPSISLPKPEEIPLDLTDGEFLAFGFQKKDRDLGHNVPQAVSLNYSGEQVDGVIRKLMFTNGLIRPGMSGAALVERASGHVIGLIHMTMNPNDDLGAYVIPVEKIWEVLQQDQKALYELLQSKNHRAGIAKQYRKEYPRNQLISKYGIRLIILPLLLLFASWWYFFHLGQIEKSGFLAVMLVGLTIVGNIMGFLIGDETKMESGKMKKGLLKVLFSPVFLSGLALVTILLWTFTSSVWVYGNSEIEDLSIMAYRGDNYEEGRQKTAPPTGKAVFLFLTSPFGDSIKVVPEGREPKFLGVSPFSKKELYYPRDFLLEPVILIRFDPVFAQMMDKYRVEIEVIRPGPPNEVTKYKLEENSLAEAGSILLGKRNLIISEERKNQWKQFFENEEISRSLLDNWVHHWTRLKKIQGIDLDIGDKIRIEVKRKDNGETRNKQEYAIRDDHTDKLIQFTFNNLSE